MPSSKDPAITQEFKINALHPEAAEDSDLISARDAALCSFRIYRKEIGAGGQAAMTQAQPYFIVMPS
jgi:hypothetical protein